MKKKFKKWVNDITKIPIEVPRSIPANKKSTSFVDPHVFGDAGIVAKCAAVYAIVNQPSAIDQGLVTSKSQIFFKNLTIPRLELVSEHMARHLKSSLKNQNA